MSLFSGNFGCKSGVFFSSVSAVYLAFLLFLIIRFSHCSQSDCLVVQFCLFVFAITKKAPQKLRFFEVYIFLQSIHLISY